MEFILFNNSKNLKGIVDDVFVKEGQPINKGDLLTTISTQLEKVEIKSPINGVVKNIFIIDSLIVSCNDKLFELVTHDELMELVREPKNINDTLKEGLDEFNYFDNYEEVETTPAVEKLEKKLEEQTIDTNNKNNDQLTFDSSKFNKKSSEVSGIESHILNKNKVQINDSITQELSFFNNTSLGMGEKVIKEDTNNFLARFRDNQENKEAIKNDNNNEKIKFIEKLHQRQNENFDKKQEHQEFRKSVDSISSHEKIVSNEETGVLKNLNSLNEFSKNNVNLDDKKINNNNHKEINSIDLTTNNIEKVSKEEIIKTSISKSSVSLSLDINQLLNLQDILYKPSIDKDVEINVSTLLTKAIVYSMSSSGAFFKNNQKFINIMQKFKNSQKRKCTSINNLGISIFNFKKELDKSNNFNLESKYMIYDFLNFNNYISSCLLNDETIFSISLNNINQLLKNDGLLYNSLSINISFDNNELSFENIMSFIDSFTEVIENPGYLI
ncbi:hypothetical protein SCORR_v1c02040 [Spiroplasma corruscae]|uniref:Lipoyl-binding domain-containing protein n=1 Tax=Spiroplasma corruscae TaxID=216934 RepID=A0A222ENA6_9MOLU|nr:biotin/lipoyl-containing protein [Spiroplasma corruscae]ASP27979.1 hypothetical protein SCORR_v1c02040 [Spiroplasma corruscae]